LLEREAERVGEIRLAHAQHHAAHTHTTANVLVDGIGKHCGHERRLSVRAPKAREEVGSYRNCGLPRQKAHGATTVGPMLQASVLRVEEVKALEREMAALKARIAELEKLENHYHEHGQIIHDLRGKS
jgi:hypothetical protein